MALRRWTMRAVGSAGFALGTLAVALGLTRRAAAAKIACVGDSITFGYNLTDPSTQSYPAVLGMELGSSDTVQNFGVSGATLLKSGDKPYWNETNFSASTSFAPDVVIVMLGTNDAKPQNWANEAEFSPDYLDLIDHYRSLGALVYVATPPPVYSPGAYDIPPDVVANEVVPLVRSIAAQANAPLVDVFTALSGKSQDFPDTVHPNAAGSALIAGAVKASLDTYGLGGATATAGAGGVGTPAGAGGAVVAAGAGGTARGGSAGANGGAPTVAGAGQPSSGGTPSATGGAPSGSGGMSNGTGGAALGAGGIAGANGGTAGRGGMSGSVASGAGSLAAGAAGAAGFCAAGTGAAGMTGSPAAGGSPSATTPEAGGCGCRAARSRSPAGAFAAWALAFGALRRRRRAA